jgi:hypothetical protein
VVRHDIIILKLNWFNEPLALYSLVSQADSTRVVDFTDFLLLSFWKCMVCVGVDVVWTWHRNALVIMA